VISNTSSMVWPVSLTTAGVQGTKPPPRGAPSSRLSQNFFFFPSRIQPSCLRYKLQDTRHSQVTWSLHSKLQLSKCTDSN